MLNLYGPSDAEVRKADASLRALEKKDILMPFKVKPRIAKWAHDSGLRATGSRQISKKSSSSSKPAATSKNTVAKYSKSYGDDSKAKADLGKHLDKHASHKRVKAM